MNEKKLKIFPAIDIIDGQCVRLKQGDYAEKTVYNVNPLVQARVFAEHGAEFLHVVDLDAAKSGEPENFEIVEKIVKQKLLKVEIGGGIRDMKIAKKYIDAGVYRIILGTAAIENPEFLREALEIFGAEKVAVGIDIKNGMVATRGWLNVTEVSVLEFCETLAAQGVMSIIVTDISKDGMGSGTNIPLYKTLREQFPKLEITASGGVASIAEIRELSSVLLDGVILGNSLYNGQINLKEAVNENN